MTCLCVDRVTPGALTCHMTTDCHCPCDPCEVEKARVRARMAAIDRHIAAGCDCAEPHDNPKEST